MADVPIYSSVDDVVAMSGIKPEDFELEDDMGSAEDALTAEDKLNALVFSWLVSIKDFIDRNRNRNYTAEETAVAAVIDKWGTVIYPATVATPVPSGIHNIALRAACNMASMALLRRETAVQRVDLVQRLKGDEVFSPALLHDLAQYPSKPRFRMAVSKTTKPNVYDILRQPGMGYYS